MPPSYGQWSPRTRSRDASWKERRTVRPCSLAVQAALSGQALQVAAS